MLVSVVVTMVAEKIGKHSPSLGRANYSEVLQWLDRTSPGLATELHDLDGPKPLTCSSLVGKTEQRDGHTFLRQGEPYSMRITGLQEHVSQAILATFWEKEQRAQQWECNGNRLRILNAFCHPNQHAWSASTTYEALAERHFLGDASRIRMDQLTLEFASPTAFKSKEMQMPLPLPNLVFGSLVDRWNRFSSVALSEQVRSFGELAVEVNQFDLRSVRVEQKNEAMRVGCIGSASYRACYQDRYWLGLFQLLADFALFSGVGVQTATGMGQVRRLSR